MTGMFLPQPTWEKKIKVLRYYLVIILIHYLIADLKSTIHEKFIEIEFIKWGTDRQTLPYLL